MSSSDVAVSVRGVSKSYSIARNAEKLTTAAEAIVNKIKHPFSKVERDTFWALKDVSFEINTGEVVGIIGRNGAGKSTILKVLSRITEPTTGQIVLNGRVGSLLEVGTGFHPELTGRENIYLNGAILGMTKAEIGRHFDDIVDFAGVEKFLDTPVKRYSSGMYVRLAFGVAAHLNPEILIVDEVLAVGDAEFQRKCLGKMQDVAKSGRTVLFVSHNMGAVRNLCSSVVWLDAGSVREIGSVNAVIGSYIKYAVEAFNSYVDLRSAPRAVDTGVTKILSITFNKGKPIQHGKPFEVDMEFETHAEVAGLALAFGLAHMDGYRLLSFDSDVYSNRVTLPANHRGNLNMRIGQLNLQPGTYLLDVGARSGDFTSLEHIGSVCQIEIVPGDSTPPTIIRNDGGVREPAKWDWQDANALLLGESAHAGTFV